MNIKYGSALDMHEIPFLSNHIFRKDLNTSRTISHPVLLVFFNVYPGCFIIKLISINYSDGRHLE